MRAIGRVAGAVFSALRREREFRRALSTYPTLLSFVYDYEMAFPTRDDVSHAAAWALKELCVSADDGRYNGFDAAAVAILCGFLQNECGLSLDMDKTAPAVLRELNAGGNLDVLAKLLTP